jgi:predicted metal-binding membrane protein
MLERTGALSVLMNSRSLSLSGALLIAAGIYQLTPFKTACLKQCRAPAVFIAAHWRRGALGGWRMGLEHGLYCLGCCAVLMLLLFVGGIMNLVWIAGLTLFIALEEACTVRSDSGASRSGPAYRRRSRPYRFRLISASRTR